MRITHRTVFCLGNVLSDLHCQGSSQQARTKDGPKNAAPSQLPFREDSELEGASEDWLSYFCHFAGCPVALKPAQYITALLRFDLAIAGGQFLSQCAAVKGPVTAERTARRP